MVFSSLNEIVLGQKRALRYRLRVRKHASTLLPITQRRHSGAVLACRLPVVWGVKQAKGWAATLVRFVNATSLWHHWKCLGSAKHMLCHDGMSFSGCMSDLASSCIATFPMSQSMLVVWAS